MEPIDTLPTPCIQNTNSDGGESNSSTGVALVTEAPSTMQWIRKKLEESFGAPIPDLQMYYGVLSASPPSGRVAILIAAVRFHNRAMKAEIMDIIETNLAHATYVMVIVAGADNLPSLCDPDLQCNIPRSIVLTCRDGLSIKQQKVIVHALKEPDKVFSLSPQALENEDVLDLCIDLEVNIPKVTKSVVLRAACVSAGDHLRLLRQHKWNDSADIPHEHTIKDANRRVKWTIQDKYGLFGFFKLQYMTVNKEVVDSLPFCFGDEVRIQLRESTTGFVQAEISGTLPSGFYLYLCPNQSAETSQKIRKWWVNKPDQIATVDLTMPAKDLTGKHLRLNSNAYYIANDIFYAADVDALLPPELPNP